MDPWTGSMGQQYSAAPPAQPRRKPWGWALIGLIVGAALVGASWAGTAIAGKVGSSETFTLHGTMLLEGDGYDDVVSTDSGCSGDGGYSDISDGTAVTVYDATGAVIATGDLENSSGDVTSCTYDIVVPGVPAGSKFYQVEVSHRGKITVSAGDAKQGKVGITLGG